MSNLLVKELKRSKYRLLGLVGQGQFGQVYCATHRKTGRLFALKELNKHRFPTHKFLRELRFLLSLQHSNIVTCYALEHTQTGRYLVMDYCEGGTLRSLIEGVQLHPIHCLKLITDILAGLDHAHSKGIVHCDIKPENILLTLQPQGWIARISDFGVARLSQEIAKGEGTATGSPAYMAPERFYGQHSHSSDLYAVGVLLFELLVGYRPFSGTPADLKSAHLNDPVKVSDAVPEELKTIILTALQKLPARRFRSAGEMLSAVQSALESLNTKPSSEWTDCKLLRPALNLPIAPCKPLQQHPLKAEVRQLVTVSGDRSRLETADLKTASNQMLATSNLATSNPATSSLATVELDRIYQVFSKSIECQIHPTSLSCSNFLLAGERSTVHLPEPIQKLIVHPQSCFAITHRSIYRIPIESFGSSLMRDQPLSRLHSSSSQPSIQDAPQLVAKFNQDFVAGIEPQGRWAAVATLGTDTLSSGLSIWQLPSPRQRSGAGYSDAPSRFGRSTIRIFYSAAYLFQLVAIDRRHFATFSHAVDASNSCITGMLLEIFTRRGDFVGGFNLPIPLRSIFTGPTPYQIAAMEPEYSTSLLLIDLKPLRTLRVGLEIVPKLVEVTSWGYVLMSSDGQIVLLNRHGHHIGRLEGPIDPTAIAVLNSLLLISTWRDGRGNLHVVDLAAIELGEPISSRG